MTKIAIIGAGFGGIGAAIRLRQAGFDDVVILERAAGLGGVWRDNTYPGCACDVESHLYSFSFAPNPSWSQAFSPQPEILAYLRRVADDFGVRSLMRFEHEVQHVEWRDERWRLQTSSGDLEADVVIAAQGALSDPRIPEIDGLASFAGKVMHTARWDHDYDVRNKRVAVIGTGASAIQLIPEIQPLVEKLLVFQRTPPWILPRRGGPIPAALRRLYERFPAAQQAARTGIAAYRELFFPLFVNPRIERVVRRQALRHLHRSVRDPLLRAKLTPDYAIGCKRILLSNEYLPAIVKPNVEVVTESIARIGTNRVIDARGAEHVVDAIVFGTGFHVTDVPLARHVRGRGGITLADAWRGSAKAFLGTTVHGFPNLFFILGPNTGLGHSSVVAMMEPQFEHIVGALRFMRERGMKTLEPTAAAQEAFVASVDRKMQATVWVNGGCRSWYLDDTGRNSTLWPRSTKAFERRVARFNPADYQGRP